MNCNADDPSCDLRWISLETRASYTHNNILLYSRLVVCFFAFFFYLRDAYVPKRYPHIVRARVWGVIWKRVTLFILVFFFSPRFQTVSIIIIIITINVGAEQTTRFAKITPLQFGIYRFSLRVHCIRHHTIIPNGKTVKWILAFTPATTCNGSCCEVSRCRNNYHHERGLAVSCKQPDKGARALSERCRRVGVIGRYSSSR